jgi:hypothetical protein
VDRNSKEKENKRRRFSAVEKQSIKKQVHRREKKKQMAGKQR